MAPGSEDYDEENSVTDQGLIAVYQDYNMSMNLRLLAEMIHGSKASCGW